MAGIVEANLTLVTVDPLTFTGKSSDLYYFAYGSNMNRKQINVRCATPKQSLWQDCRTIRLPFSAIPGPGTGLWRRSFRSRAKRFGASSTT